MQSFSFGSSVPLHFGRGAVRENLVRVLGGAKKVLLLSGKGNAAKSGALKDVREALSGSGIAFAERNGVVRGFSVSDVRDAALFCTKVACGTVISIGGGAAQDFGKLLSRELPGLCQAAVPTGLGTGAGLNGDAWLRDPEAVEGSFVPCPAPVAAIVDPAYLETLGKEDFFSGAFFAFGRLAENYLAPAPALSASDGMNEGLQKTVFDSLVRLESDIWDRDARSVLLIASAALGSKVLRAGKAAPSPAFLASMRLSSVSGCRPGDALSAVLPFFLRKQFGKDTWKFSHWASRVWGIDDPDLSIEERGRQGVEALAAFIRELGLPTRLTSIGCGEEMVKEVANTFEMEALEEVGLTRDDLRGILAEALE